MKSNLGGGVLAVVAALLLAAGAEPAQGFVFPAGKSMQMELRGSNGFRVGIEASGRNLLVVNVSKRESVVVYVTRNATIGGGRIAGVLPGIGRIAVEFQPRGKPEFEEPFPGCRGRPERTQRGVFVGTITLRGEGGFTTVDRQRARGQVLRSYGQKCSGGDGDDDSSGIERTDLYASSASGANVAFSASHWDPESELRDDFTSFSVSLVERRRELIITRLAFALGGPKRFGFDPPSAPTSATIKPPKPFTGSAAFAAGADGGGSWTGDLSVEFLGLAKPVRLAGERFEAEVCRGSKCAGKVGR